MANWEDYFIDAIAKLRARNFVPHSLSQADFKRTSDSMWTALKRKHSDWKNLLNPTTPVEQLVAPRATFKNKDYIENVFTTKPGTLVFTMKNYPGIVVKIDNRPAADFESGVFRSYYDASVKAQFIQGNAFAGEFDLLFLPYEVGRDSQEVKVKAVFSETLPSFSTSELDHRVLLHKLLVKSQSDDLIKVRLNSLFEQMLTYICRVNFDDINFRNVPFTSDGRLAPFDTDSFLRRTGFNTFLSTFFAYKIIPIQKAKIIAQNHCEDHSKYVEDRLKDVYNDADLNIEFNRNERTLQEMISFLSSAPDQINFSSLDLRNIPNGQKNAVILGNALMAKVLSTDKQSILGKRCAYIHDAIQTGVDATSDPANPDNFEIMKQILEVARVAGKIYASDAISTLGKSIVTNLKDYICY